MAVTGFGGVFVKANDPPALCAWYEKHLGVQFAGNTYTVFIWAKDPAPASQQYSVFSFSPNDSNYFAPSEKAAMLNFRVSGLMEMLEQLKADGVQVMEKTEVGEYGKFGWIIDPEGNKVELWEPPGE